MSTALTVKLHLRRAWDQHFMPGATSTDLAVRRLRMAAHRLGLVVVTEYRENYPAPGLSGVLFTRMPRDVKVSKAAGMKGNRANGL